MSSGNAHQERLHEELDAAIEENAPTGKLEDAEIQRLVQLSNDASYQRSERVPVKTVEAFEPRSLVSIAMAAQRRRESELQTAMAAGAVIDEEAADPAEASVDAAVATGEEAAAAADQLAMDEAGAHESSADATGDVTTVMKRRKARQRKTRRPPHRRSILRLVGPKGWRKVAVPGLTKVRPRAWKRAGRRPRRSFGAA